MGERSLSFDDLVGELHEFATRVVALEMRDADGTLLASAEGELGGLGRGEGGECTFELGGNPPPEVDGVRFIVASWLTVHLDPERVVEVHDIASGVGVSVVLRIRLVGGLEIQVWPAMPLGQQWTEQHEENR